MNTLIELYDERAIENILAPDMFRPRRIVYLCPGEIAQDRTRQETLAAFFRRRGWEPELIFVETSLFKADRILRQLFTIGERFPDCAIDVTGGSDAALFAAGMFAAKEGVPAFTYSRKKNRFYDISGAAFAGLVGGLIFWLPSYKEKKEMEAIKPQETQNAAPPTEEPEATPDPAAEEAAQRAKYADLIARNPEFAGWIEIPGVDIDLPILQTTDNYFYLYHDLDRADDKRGMPFADYECDMKNGRHLIIYGHNMGVNNTDRFSNLQKYRDADYYTAHPYLQLDTLYRSEIYKIVAVYAVTSRESDGDVFHFNQYIDLDDAAEQTFLDEVAKRAFYTTGDYAYPTERLLTLSTCTYQMDDARMVILARPLRDGETTEADTVHINSDPLLPARWPAGK